MQGGGRGVKGVLPCEVGNAGEQSVNLALSMQSQKHRLDSTAVGETVGCLCLELREGGAGWRWEHVK